MYCHIRVHFLQHYSIQEDRYHSVKSVKNESIDQAHQNIELPVEDLPRLLLLLQGWGQHRSIDSHEELGDHHLVLYKYCKEAGISMFAGAQSQFWFRAHWVVMTQKKNPLSTLHVFHMVCIESQSL